MRTIAIPILSGALLILSAIGCNANYSTVRVYDMYNPVLLGPVEQIGNGRFANRLSRKNAFNVELYNSGQVMEHRLEAFGIRLQDEMKAREVYGEKLIQVDRVKVVHYESFFLRIHVLYHSIQK